MNVAQILEAIRASRDVVEPDDCHTGPEIRRALGWGNAKFAREMARLIEERKVTLHRVRRTAVDRRSANVPAYQFHEAQ